MSKTKFSKRLNKLYKSDSHKLTGIIVIVILALLGVRLLTLSHAQSPYSSSEAESGTLTQPANIQSDPNASGGSYVKFGNPLAIHTKGNLLVDGNGKTIRLLGFDVPGSEAACIKNTGLSYYPSDSSADSAATATALLKWHINAVRIPLNEDCWLGINAVNPAYSGQNYITSIQDWVAALNKVGIYAILDLHWAAPGTYQSNTQWPMTDEDHAPLFWQQVATSFKSNPAVIFDLFNEPYLGKDSSITTDQPPWNCWLNGCNASFTTSINGVLTPVPYVTAGMKELVKTVRDTGALQPIEIGGLHYSADPCGLWGKFGDTSACPQVSNMPTDSANQLIVSYHNYYANNVCTDPVTNTTCLVNHWNSEINPILAANIPVVTDEFGEYDCQTTFMNNYMTWADQNNQSYLAWGWQAGSGVCYAYPDSNDWTNWKLIQDWNGTPSNTPPQGLNYYNHLIQVSPY